MSTLRKLVLGVLTAALLLAVVEVVLTLVVPRETLLFEWEQPQGGWFYEQTGNLAMRADRTETLHDGPYAYTYTINLQGYREAGEVPLEKAPGTTRILALGDSWMFGMNATTGRDVPGQLEAIVPAAGGPALDVVNGGIMGASGFDMLQQWRKATALDLDGVLLGLPHNNGRQAEAEDLRGQLYDQPPGPASDLRLYLALRLLLAPHLRQPYAVLTDIDGAIADVLVIVEEAQARGLDVWFLYWPTSWEGVQHNRWKPEQPPWIEALEPRGVPYTGHRLPSRSCWGYHDDSHPSEAGYRVLAEVAAQMILTGESHAEGRAEPTCEEVEECGPGKEGCFPPEDGPSFRLLSNPGTPGQPDVVPQVREEGDAGPLRPDERPPPPGDGTPLRPDERPPPPGDGTPLRADEAPPG